MSSYILEVRDENGNSVFSHDMDYENGKLKFIPSGKTIKDAIKAAEKKIEDDMPDHHKTHNAAMKPIDEAIDAAIKAKGHERFVIYSIYKDYDNPTNQLAEVAVEGKVQFVYKTWIGNDSKYTSPVLENPTWLDVMVLANEAMLITGDFHHCFLEAVYKMEEDSNNPEIYTFSMGS